MPFLTAGASGAAALIWWRFGGLLLAVLIFAASLLSANVLAALVVAVSPFPATLDLALALTPSLAVLAGGRDVEAGHEVDGEPAEECGQGAPPRGGRTERTDESIEALRIHGSPSCFHWLAHRARSLPDRSSTSVRLCVLFALLALLLLFLDAHTLVASLAALETAIRPAAFALRAAGVDRFDAGEVGVVFRVVAAEEPWIAVAERATALPSRAAGRIAPTTSVVAADLSDGTAVVTAGRQAVTGAGVAVEHVVGSAGQHATAFAGNLPRLALTLLILLTPALREVKRGVGSAVQGVGMDAVPVRADLIPDWTALPRIRNAKDVAEAAVAAAAYGITASCIELAIAQRLAMAAHNFADVIGAIV
jgi:hypothetical protein